MATPIVERRKLPMPRLSAHEMAALILLGYAAVEVEVEDLDMTALRDVGLAQRVKREPGSRSTRSRARAGRCCGFCVHWLLPKTWLTGLLRPTRSG